MLNGWVHSIVGEAVGIIRASSGNIDRLGRFSSGSASMNARPWVASFARRASLR